MTVAKLSRWPAERVGFGPTRQVAAPIGTPGRRNRAAKDGPRTLKLLGRPLRQLWRRRSRSLRGGAAARRRLFGSSLGEAVTQSVAAPLLRRPPLTKPIPKSPLRDLLFNRHLRDGNLPALFADLAKRHGPVFESSLPFQKERMIFLAGERTNRWAHRRGRMYLRAKDYFRFELASSPPKRLINSFPSQSASDKIRFRIFEQRHELPV